MLFRAPFLLFVGNALANQSRTVRFAKAASNWKVTLKLKKKKKNLTEKLWK